ncbi:MAG TPA: 2'-5' RNA ligase family protein [Sedimentisphaerales bacterium]|nr:2'-5' RNA ligase family protein [Sedimentisphaerales bacterium]
MNKSQQKLRPDNNALAVRINMGKKAVDVVLLPDEAMTNKAIEANGELVRQCGEKIVLNKQTCLPHISLAMGCIDERDIPEIKKVVEQIAEKTSLSRLTVIGIRTSTSSVGEEISVFELQKTQELQALHEAIMERLAPYLSSDVTKEMLYNPAEVGQPTLSWIQNYRQNSGFENFFPHITIGYGRMENGPFPVQFTPSTLAVCHLGSHCTCRKVLARVDLESR